MPVQKLILFVQSQPRAAALYTCFGVGCFMMYRMVQAPPSGTYDHLLTLSASVQTLAFCLLVAETRHGVGEGLSEKALWAFFIANVTRLSTTTWGEGYVPEDNTGDVMLYQIMEIVGVLLMGYQLLKLNTLRSIHDVGQGSERWSLVAVMVVAAMGLAVFTKSTGHNDYFADVSWMFSVWLEAFALLPQVMLLKSISAVDESMMHFVALTVVASLIWGIFWGRIANERMSDNRDNIFFWGILSAAAIRSILCATYLYLFVQAKNAKLGRDPHGDEML